MSSEEKKPSSLLNRLVVIFVIAVVVAEIAFMPVRRGFAIAQMPKAVDRPVSYEADILPILDLRCGKCHADKARKGRFQFDTSERFLAGAESGPVAIAGSSWRSMIVQQVAHVPGVSSMPKGNGPPMPDEEVAMLRAWIDQGMKFESEPAPQE